MRASESSGIHTQHDTRIGRCTTRVKDTGVISPVIAILHAGYTANGRLCMLDRGSRANAHTSSPVNATLVMQAGGMLSCHGSFGRLRFDDLSCAMELASTASWNILHEILSYQKSAQRFDSWLAVSFNPLSGNVALSQHFIGYSLPVHSHDGILLLNGALIKRNSNDLLKISPLLLLLPSRFHNIMEFEGIGMSRA